MKAPRTPVLDRLPVRPRRVAVVRALLVGDMLVAVPALRALREALPEAEVTLVGLPWAADLVRRLPRYLDAFLPFPGFPGIKEREPDGGSLPGFLAEARARRFDLAVQMHGSGTCSNPLTRLLGARRTAGLVTPGGAGGLDFPLPYVEGRHEVHRWLDLVEFLTGRRGDARLEYPVLAGDHAELAAAGFDATGRPYLVAHPGARARSRQWMPGRFAEAADRLARLFGLEVVVSGGPGEEAIVERVSGLLQRPPRPVPVTIGLGALAALIEGARLLVSNDTAAAHLANAVGTRSVVVYGSAHVASWRPLDLTRHRTLFVPMPCRPHGCAACPHDFECLRAIGADRVVAAARELLEAGALPV